ncbi:MAG: hypothetical protein P8077_10275, partial [Gammaproteobacteria bacterium]
MLTSFDVNSHTLHHNEANYARHIKDPIFGNISINTTVKTNGRIRSSTPLSSPLTDNPQHQTIPQINTLPTPPEDSSSFHEQSTYFQNLGHALAKTNLAQREPYRISSIKIDFSQSQDPELGSVLVHR